MNHNVETCKSKEPNELVQIIAKVTTQANKPPKPVKYSYHICGIGGHKLMKCPRFVKMQKMFQRIHETVGYEALVKNANLSATMVNMVEVVSTKNNVNKQ
jgi:hypothetical protein